MEMFSLQVTQKSICFKHYSIYTGKYISVNHLWYNKMCFNYNV